MRILLLLPALFFFALAPGQSFAAEVRPDHLLVGFRDNLSRSTEQSILGDAGTDTVRRMGSIDVSLIRLEKGVSRSEAVRELRQSGAVEFVEADYRLQAAAVPSDTFFSQMWGMNNTGQMVGSVSGTADADIDAPEAWNLETGLGGGVVVGIADTGIDLQHGDLVPNLWQNPGEIAGNGIDDDGNGKVDDVRGWNWVSGNANPDDDNYHGTHVAGTVAARGDNSKGVTGVSWGAKIAALKVLDSDGSGYTSDVAASAAYAGQMGFDVYNASLGGGSFSQTFLSAIQAYPNTLYVFAAGNNGQNIESSKYYPCSYNSPNTLCVASSNSSDQLAGTSNYGQTEVDLAAPGVTVLSTYPQTGSGTDQYAYLSGTSMATPHVAGAAALLRQTAPGSSVANLRNWILDSTNPLSALAGKVASGGRLNLLASVELALASAEDDPPTLQITSEEKAWINTESPSWQFQATRADSVLCSLQPEGVAESWSACTSPYQASGLVDGTSYTFSVRAENAFGSVTKENTFTVDLQAPGVPEILSGPPAVGQSRDIRFTFQGEAGTKFLCSVDRGSTPSWVPCSGGSGTDGLSEHQRIGIDDGYYTFRVRQEDLAGNLSDAASREFVVDNVAPSAPSVLSGPPAWSASSSATVSFIHEGSAQCSLDGAAFADCSSPWSVSGLEDGPHTLRLRARDAAGNVSIETSREEWTVDTVAPSAPTVAGPSGLTAFRNVSFSFGAEPGASLMCGLDSLRPCSSSVAYLDLAPGDYTLSVRQADRAGNLSPLREHSFQVGDDGPELVLGEMPASPSSELRPQFFWSLGDPSYEVLCSVETGAPYWRPCTTKSSYVLDYDLDQGTNVFRVRVLDAQGSWLERSYSFVIDRTAPVFTFSGVGGLRNTREATVGFSANESSTFRCSLDGAAWESCQSPWSGSDLPDGLRRLRVEARDLAGNTRALDFIWTIDATAPAAPQLRALQENSVEIESEEGALLECRLGEGDWEACTSPWSRNLPDGTYTLYARARDAAGNTSEEGSFSWRAGPEPLPLPEVRVDLDQGLVWFSGGSDYLCSWNDSEMTACSSPYPIDRWTNGTYSYAVQIKEGSRVSDLAEGSFAISNVPAPPDTETYVVFPRERFWQKQRQIQLQTSWPIGARSFLFAGQSYDLQRMQTVQIPSGWQSGQQIVPIAFLGAGGATLWEGSLKVLLDDLRPQVLRATARKKARSRFLIQIAARDRHSGTWAAQWSSAGRNPMRKINGRRVIGRGGRILVTGKTPRWVRVLDRAGNWSQWKKITQRP